MLPKTLSITSNIIFASLLAGCGQDSSSSVKPFTGVMRTKDGVEFAAIDMPTQIGGACKGWSRLEIRKPGSGTGTGTSTVACWKRDGDDIAITGESGQRQSGPAKFWVD